MTKFYFFQISREANAQGQFWTMLHAIPGQQTPCYDLHPAEAIDPALKVQLCALENGKAARIVRHCPVGAIVGVKYESDAMRELVLKKYRHGDTYIYRTDNEIFLVDSNTADRGTILSSVPHLRMADAEMIAAYDDVIGGGVSSTAASTAQASQPAPAAEASASPRQNENGIPVTELPLILVETRISQNELDSVATHLDVSLSDAAAKSKLLVISKIRDQMRVGLCKFSYLKTNGDTRIAYGTRNQSIIQMLSGDTNNESSGNGQNDGGHFHYFDIQRCAWRCFCTEEVLTVLSPMPIVNLSTINRIAGQPVAA